MKLEQFCGRSGRSRLPELQTALAALPSVGASGPWLCGGSLRRLILGEDPLASDLDFFFKSEAQADLFEKELLESTSAKLVFKSATARTFRVVAPGVPEPLTVQVIKLDFYESCAACIDTFDFTICQLGFDGEELHLGEFTLWDLGRKSLVVHKVTYATATVRRLVKYTKQGFASCVGVAQAILESVAKDPTIIHPESEYVD